ncbi:MAG: RNA polymerase sigma factor [Fimbriimonadales bacterium]
MQDRNPSTAERSEQSLVFSVASGDEAAAAELFRIYGEPVLRFVYRRVGEQMEDAEEVTLDTFGSAVKLAGTYHPASSVFTWLCGIAKLRIIDFYRKAGRDKRMPAHLQTSLEDLERGDGGIAGQALPLQSRPLDHVLDRIETERIVDELLSGLSEEEREVLLLRYVEQFSVREIAMLTKRSERGVEGLLSRAKNKPRALLERWLDGGAQ